MTDVLKLHLSKPSWLLNKERDWTSLEKD